MRTDTHEHVVVGPGKSEWIKMARLPSGYVVRLSQSPAKRMEWGFIRDGKDWVDRVTDAVLEEICATLNS